MLYKELSLSGRAALHPAYCDEPGNTKLHVHERQLVDLCRKATSEAQGSQACTQVYSGIMNSPDVDMKALNEHILADVPEYKQLDDDDQSWIKHNLWRQTSAVYVTNPFLLANVARSLVPLPDTFDWFDASSDTYARLKVLVLSGVNTVSDWGIHGIAVIPSTARKLAYGQLQLFFHPAVESHHSRRNVKARVTAYIFEDASCVAKVLDVFDGKVTLQQGQIWNCELLKERVLSQLLVSIIGC